MTTHTHIIQMPNYNAKAICIETDTEVVLEFEIPNPACQEIATWILATLARYNSEPRPLKIRNSDTGKIAIVHKNTNHHTIVFIDP